MRNAGELSGQGGGWCEQREEKLYREAAVINTETSEVFNDCLKRIIDHFMEAIQFADNEKHEVSFRRSRSSISLMFLEAERLRVAEAIEIIALFQRTVLIYVYMYICIYDSEKDPRDSRGPLTRLGRDTASATLQKRRIFTQRTSLLLPQCRERTDVRTRFLQKVQQTTGLSRAY